MSGTVCIFHGYGGNKPGSWLTWLDSSLKKLGYKTIYPNFPFMGSSTIADWFEEFKKNVGDIDEPITIVGHSGGTTFAFYVAQHMNFHIDKLILAAPINDIVGADYALTLRPGKEAEIPYLRNFIHQHFDFSIIKSKVKKITFLLSDNDHLIPYQDTIEYFQSIFPEATYITLRGYGHINEKANVRELPEVLDLITDSSGD